MTDLSHQSCVPCEGGTPPLSRDEATSLLSEVPQWRLDDTHISRHFVFKNFKEALAFVNTIGEAAEHEGHHPDIHLTAYKNVTVELSTHAIKGLSKNDFIVAAKIDALYESAAR